MNWIECGALTDALYTGVFSPQLGAWYPQLTSMQ